jgi:hypothetical protein
MNKQFKTYKELIDEKQNLEVLLKAQKELIRADVAELKAEVKPITDFISNAKKFFTRDKTEILLNIGSDLAVNTLIKKVLLARAGWLTRVIIPYFMKNFTSNFLVEQKDKWLGKLAQWLHWSKNGKDAEKEAREERKGEEDLF